MTLSTSKRRFTAAALTAAALTISVPVAQAQSPDAFERAVASQQQSPSFVGSPDAIDRAVAAREANKVELALDVRERALTERPATTTTTTTPGPDAFERALITHANEQTLKTAAMLDARERSFASRPVGSVQHPTMSGRGLDWGDFGIGAGAGLGSALVLVLLGAAILGSRRTHDRATTA
jgi:hypothetical protein